MMLNGHRGMLSGFIVFLEGKRELSAVSGAVFVLKCTELSLTLLCCFCKEEKKGTFVKFECIAGHPFLFCSFRESLL